MEVKNGSIQAGIYRIYACMISKLPKMPKNPVFSRGCGILVKMQSYRILSENGVV